MNKVLVIAAHADDEALGCAGTIAKHIDNGDIVELIVMTDGVSARPEHITNEITVRNEMLKASSKTLGISKIHQFNFPDNQMDSIPLLSVVQAIESVIGYYQPNVIYTHCAQDLNIDHQLTHRAVMTACRPQPNCPVKQILCFEVKSGTDWQPSSQAQFTPNWFIDISEYWQIKSQTLVDYNKEMMPWPHARSIDAVKALAQSRGSQVGVELAEAFYLERCICL
ncbi:PIG-L deacetylase family protein [Pseudoalteromonas denitrificans]|uniref:N-acetylglucosaminyl deacetylase, LmbE family n=1 Tax=Pseudoalteromonas denitrificans DSM 6059 TaxID=1123010 RepID=A0A1I1HKH6_9GAMM|nr:PIG-L family deacetylase [Pseudoalteromonas denitrificans]SFC24326.1 N-acetylglucosaminyl deacetylase, LmbE family [Pseudoalteromonas denitrificans DSM 6059]